jgi:hypothetical protein
MKMEAAGTLDILEPIYQTTRHHIPEDILLLMRKILTRSFAIFSCGE